MVTGPQSIDGGVQTNLLVLKRTVHKHGEIAVHPALANDEERENVRAHLRPWLRRCGIAPVFSLRSKQQN